MEDKIRQSKIINKAIIIVSVLLFFALLVYLGKDAMLNYRHPSLHFLIKYPSKWMKIENYQGAVVVFLSPKQSSADSFQENVNVVVQDLTDNVMSLEKYTETAIFQLKVVFKGDIQEIESGPEYVGGKPGYKFVYVAKSEPLFKIEHVWTIDDNKAYQITYTAVASEFDEYKEKVEKMIKSFRFF